MKRPLLAVLLAAAACSSDGGGGGELIFEYGEPWAWESPYPGPGTGRVIFTNAGDDTVSIIDLQTLAPFWTTPVGRVPAELEAPHHCAVDPSGEHFYVGISYFTGQGAGPHGNHGGGENDGYALKYRASDNLLVGELRVDRNPGDIRITHDGSKLLVSHFDLLRIIEVLDAGGTEDEMRSSVRIIDSETMTLLREVFVCPAIHGILPSADDSVAYLACYGSDQLAVVSLVDESAPPELFPVGPAPGTIGMPAYGPYAVGVSPSDGSVWVSNTDSGEIRIWDPLTRAFDESRVITTGGVPFFGDFTADGSTYIVAVQGTNRVAFIDTATATVAQQVDLPLAACLSPHTVKIMPGESDALVVCEGDHSGPGQVAVLRLGPRAIDRVFEVGVYPDDACVLPGGSP